MFDRVAPRYDLLNTLLSLGQDRRWRQVAARAADPGGGRILDVAAGTGALARELIARGARTVVAIDLSERMVRTGAARLDTDGVPDVRWVVGDAGRLPFPDATFDAVTIAFGLRNLPDPGAALAEFARVARPGARLVVLEFSAPTAPLLRQLYPHYLRRVLPTVARLMAPDPAAYRYLADSIALWPTRARLAAWMQQAGWDQVRVRDLSGGIVSIHRAVRASRPTTLGATTEDA